MRWILDRAVRTLDTVIACCVLDKTLPTNSMLNEALPVELEVEILFYDDNQRKMINFKLGK